MVVFRSRKEERVINIRLLLLLIPEQRPYILLYINLFFTVLCYTISRLISSKPGRDEPHLKSRQGLIGTVVSTVNRTKIILPFLRTTVKRTKVNKRGKVFSGYVMKDVVSWT